MINDMIEYLRNKKILILGFGREGQSTYKVIRKYLKEQQLYISDIKEDFQNNFEFLKEDKNVNFISGEKYLDNLENYDLIVKTPGISFAGMDTSAFKCKITSQIELLLKFFDIYTIGITGTKGKSTTSSLIYKVLKDQNKDVMLLGNIGVPVLECINDLNKDTILVLEISAHQLEFMDLSPNIAILLNIYEEHLDHYNSYNEYALAKCNIYKFQKPTDYFLYSMDNEKLSELVDKTEGTTYKVSMENKVGSSIYLKNEMVYFNDKPIYNENEERNLKGAYNLNNIMFVLGVSEILKLDLNKTIKSISEFKTLNHRLELVGTFNDVSYYDNSIATIPMATIEAIKALKNVDTLIIGGMDRGLDYSEFINYLNKCDVSNIICMPKTGHDIAKKLKPEKVNIVETLEEAVDVAAKKTSKGKICLLSPAAASYGFFKNFEEKGDKFKELVKKIK